jgi:GTPase SAR1 family protein
MVKEHGDEHAEILILGNKIDLINDRVVSEEEAQEFASDYGV